MFHFCKFLSRFKSLSLQKLPAQKQTRASTFAWRFKLMLKTKSPLSIYNFGFIKSARARFTLQLCFGSKRENKVRLAEDLLIKIYNCIHNFFVCILLHVQDIYNRLSSVFYKACILSLKYFSWEICYTQL